MVTTKINIDLAKKTTAPVVYAMQNDSDSRVVEAHLFVNGLPFDIGEASLSVLFQKPDGKGGWYDKLPDESNAITVKDGNVVSAILAPQVLNAAGVVIAAIRVDFADGSILSTFPFKIFVENDPAFGGEESNDYFNVSNWAEVNEEISNIKGSLSKALVLNENGFFDAGGKELRVGALEIDPGLETIGVRLDVEVPEPIEGEGRPTGVLSFYDSSYDRAVILRNVAGGERDNDAATVGQVREAVKGIEVEDGFSPTAKVEETAEGAKITITDKNGTTTVTVKNGKDGTGGGTAEGAVLYTEQELSEEQQAQARKNITAVGGVYRVGKNLIDPNTFVEGEVPGSNGSFVALSNCKRTGYIHIAPGTYVYSSETPSYSNFRWVKYNMDKSPMTPINEGITFGIGADYTVITADTECYVVLGDLKGRQKMQLEKGIVATSYEAYFKNDVFYDVSDQIDTHNFKGKTILFDGDSITAGDGFTAQEKENTIYPAIVANTLGMKLVNHAIGGSTAASKNPESDNTKQPLALRFQDYTEDADIIYIAIGTNDWAYSYTEIGSMEDREDGTNGATPYTFYGALHTICRGMLNKYPGKAIIFATPIKRRLQESDTNPNAAVRNGKTLKEYGEIIKEVCDWYSIPVIDMYSECNITPFIDEQRNAFFQETTGGTHPNGAGQAVMARRVLAGIRSIIGL